MGMLVQSYYRYRRRGSRARDLTPNALALAATSNDLT